MTLRTKAPKGLLFAALVVFTLPAFAQDTPKQDTALFGPAQTVSVPAEDADRVVLEGNIPGQAQAGVDVGVTDPRLPMERMILTLRLSPEKKEALERLLEEQQDPASLHFHCWLTPEEFGERFGLSPEELIQVTDWLQSQGFTVEGVAKGRTWINFTGTVSDVERAFRTEIHDYMVGGVLHHANVRNPSIPALLASLVGGVVSLNDFRHKAMHAPPQPMGQGLHPEYTNGSTHYMAPGDFAIIYDVNYGTYTGSGVTIAVPARSHSTTLLTDYTAFRSTFNLPASSPVVTINGPDPGDADSGDDTETDLDIQWAGGVAKGATVNCVISEATTSTDGIDLSNQYIVDNNLAAVVGVSYGSCEASMGSAEQAFYFNLWAQAAAQGMTVSVASGDGGPAGCDNYNSSYEMGGYAVSGLASTPYNLALGGTDFNEGSGTYWSTTNGSGYVSALSYIPERAYNESSYAAVAGVCPSNVTCSGLWSTSGGPSTLYAKPSWQLAVTGMPADGHRDLPDLSLSAGSHDGYFIVYGGNVYVSGGTSASAQAFGGLMALIVQKAGRQGNAGVALYKLGYAQYNLSGTAVFHDTTVGNNYVCNAFTCTTSTYIGYACGTGYDLATGLGSVDANVLLANWPSYSISGTVTLGGSGLAGVTVTALPGTASAVTAGDGTYTISGLPNGTFTATPVLSGYAFSPSSYPVTVASANVTGVNFTATSGACASAPTWNGGPSASSGGGSSCSVVLSWSAATSNCSGGSIAYYNVYRSTTSGFTPSASNLLAAGVTGTSFTDSSPLSFATTYYYVVRAVEAKNSLESTNTTAASVVPSGPSSSASVPMTDDSFSATSITGGTWNAYVVAGSGGTWTAVTTGTHPTLSAPHSGSYMVRFNSYTCAAGTRYILGKAAAVSIPSSAAAVTLTFWMYHDTGYSTSGDTISAAGSTDGWAHFFPLTTGPISRYASTAGWQQYALDLTSLRGTSLYIGFDATSGYGNNMFIDDVMVTVNTPLLDGFEGLTNDWAVQTVTSGTGCNFPYGWGVVGSGTNPTVSPHGGAEMAEYDSQHCSSGTQYRLVWAPNPTRAITSFTIPGSASAATLSFYMYHDTNAPTYTDSITPQISTNGGSSWSPGSAILRYAASSNAWSLATRDLSSYAGQTVTIGFLGYSNHSGYNMYIDDVTVSYTAGSACNPGAGAPASVKPVPDGQWVAGTPEKATKAVSDGSSVNLTWDASTCRDTNYNLLYGNGSQVSSYTPAGSACSLGNTGSASGVPLPAVPGGEAFMWWVIVGTDGISVESSWGKNSSGGERHPAASGQCSCSAKSTAVTCP